MRYKILFFVILISVNHSSLSAANIQNLSVEAYYVSSFIWRGFDATPDNNAAFQPSLTYTFGKT
ncbi:hypothetical protein ACFL40_01595, partial [candidate division KSB1 bacterium]